MSAIHELYKKLDITLSNGTVENNIYTILAQIVSAAYRQINISDEGYCFKFNLPIQTIHKLTNDLNLTEKEISDAFVKDWGSQLTIMHKDLYYQILLLLLYYSIKKDKQFLSVNSLMIILMKVWNGRKHTFFKYCDKRVMHYVINNMTSNRHEVTKCSDPVNLLKEYFVPSILKKYGPEIDENPEKLKRLFEQCYSRIYQLFVQNPRYNPATQKNEAQGGLLPLYMKAKKEGLYMQSSNIQMGEDEPSFDVYTTSNNRDEITNTVVDNIVMNTSQHYPNTIIDQINKNTKVATKNIVKILSAIHNHQYHEVLTDIISIILSKTNVIDKSDICNPNFKSNIKKNIIASKNNTDIKKLQILLNKMLETILPQIGNISLSQYSNVHQMQIRNVIIYGLEYNLIKNICR